MKTPIRSETRLQRPRKQTFKPFDVFKKLSIGFVFILCLGAMAYADDDSSAPAMDTYNKAVKLYQAQHWDAAKEYFHEYLAEYSDTPLYVTCLYYLAYCYQQLGRREQAILLYNKVIDQAKGPDAFWADMAQKRLDELIGD